ncbi:ABC transporter substrate-binding protein [Fodinibius sp. Rm-B-1B1-1]|uniref:ABC transporter substrate-binding protein n=1 Tax=Fodinibius alkaliphilus TaxID=3140241 RepID=UPI00315AAE87
MKSLHLYRNLPVFALLILLLWGCKQPETVIINDAPRTTAEADTTDQTTDESASFQKLVIGEYQSITSFDPLLANNSATLRALQLIYEGLVRLNNTGDVTPAVAKSWEVSPDSTRYTFQLNRNIYYHDNDVFSTGTGRRLTANDVKFVFERMALKGVPKKAANLFMNIRGFEPFFQEQQHIYVPKQRTLADVSGIQTPNDSTVVFELKQKDPRFLKKLATPYAVIYPHEAVNSSQNTFAPVGTGPFRFSTNRSDSLYVFSKSEKYRQQSQIQLNRADIITGQSEKQLLRQLGTEDIGVLPQMGPNMIQNLIGNNGELIPSYKGQFVLNKRNLPTTFALYHNGNAPFSSADAQRLSALAYEHTSQYFGQLPTSIVYPDSLPQSSLFDTTLAADQIDVIYSDDPYVRTYLGSLSKVVSQQNTKLQMVEIRVPTSDTELYFKKGLPLIDNNDNSNEPIFRFYVHPPSLQRSGVQNLNFNDYVWWIDLRNVTVPTTD